MNMKVMVAVFLVFICVSNIRAQINTNIINQITIGGDDDETPGNIIQTSDGGYLFTGYTRSGYSGDMPNAPNGGIDIWLIKLNDQLNIEWQKLLGGSDWETFPKIIDHEGALYLISISSSPVSGTKSTPLYSNADFWVIKMDYSGNEIWQKEYYPDSTSSVNDAKVISIGQDIVFCGSSHSGIGGMKTDTCRGNSDIWLMSIDTSGTVLWDKTVGGSFLDYPSSISFSQNLIFLNILCSSEISGDIQLPSFDAAIGNYDYVVFSLNPDSLLIVNQYRFGGDQADFITNTIATLNAYYSFGYSFSDTSSVKSEHNRGVPGSTSDFYMVQYQADGTLLADKTIGGSESEWLYDVKMVDPNQFVLYGASNSPVSGEKTEAQVGYIDYYIMSVDTNFNILWQKVLGSSDNDYGVAFTSPGLNDYVLAGHSNGGVSGDKTGYNRGMDDFWLLEISNNLSVENFSLLVLSVYPNPVINSVSFDMPENITNGLVYIFNSSGAIVQSTQVINGQHSIDVSALAAGNYFISFIPKSGQSYSGQFVKE